jgi:HAD superfamily hydrolase (TIGR01459 family)
MSARTIPSDHKSFRSVAGFRDLAPQCDALICDVWGVLHNGEAAFPDALACLAEIRKGGAPVILVSNSPKPAAAMEGQLSAFGIFAGQHYDAVLTAGELARSAALSRVGELCYHLGPDRDSVTLAGLEGFLTDSIEAADYILCTGLLNEEDETVEDYGDLFRAALSRPRPMICANPDLIVHYGEREIPCAGLLAASYEALGGEVLYFGKPYPEIYRQSLAWIAKLLGRVPSPRRVVALGDGLNTDIRGAQQAGLASAFIASGIHRHGEDEALDMDDQRLGALFEVQDCWPDWVMGRMVW